MSVDLSENIQRQVHVHNPGQTQMPGIVTQAEGITAGTEQELTPLDSANQQPTATNANPQTAPSQQPMNTSAPTYPFQPGLTGNPFLIGAGNQQMPPPPNPVGPPGSLGQQHAPATVQGMPTGLRPPMPRSPGSSPWQLASPISTAQPQNQQYQQQVITQLIQHQQSMMAMMQQA